MVEISASPLRIFTAISPVVHAELVVVDGQRCNAAALADALLAGDDGHFVGSATLSMASAQEAAVLSVGT